MILLGILYVTRLQQLNRTRHERVLRTFKIRVLTHVLVFIELCLLYITILSRERVGGGCLEETALHKFVHRVMHIN